MSSKIPAKEENGRQNIQRAQQGDRKIRQQMITENMGLVYMVAKRFANRGTDLQDLTQIGVIGLIKATGLTLRYPTLFLPMRFRLLWGKSGDFYGMTV